VATVDEEGIISLRLRLPNALSGKHTIISGLRFAHGHDAMVAAIGRNLSNDKQEWQAISYRFKKDEKGWRVFVSISLPEVKRIADRRLEVSGVDSNKDHLAVTETDRFGNLIAFWTIPCCTYGTSSDRSKAIVSEAVKALLTIPLTERSPLLSRSLTFGRRRLLWKKKTSDMRGCFHRSPSVSFSRL